MVTKMSLIKHTVKIAGTKYRFRLYADGTIIDQETNKILGYIQGEQLEEIFMLRPIATQQKAIRDYMRTELGING
jgi:hypothetical protein